MAQLTLFGLMDNAQADVPKGKVETHLPYLQQVLRLPFNFLFSQKEREKAFASIPRLQPPRILRMRHTL